MSLSTLTSKGQTTVPKEVREHLKIQAGDRIEFVIKKDGSVILKPGRIDVSELGGLLKSRAGKTSVTLEDMNRALRDRWKQRQ